MRNGSVLSQELWHYFVCFQPCSLPPSAPTPPSSYRLIWCEVDALNLSHLKVYFWQVLLQNLSPVTPHLPCFVNSPWVLCLLHILPHHLTLSSFGFLSIFLGFSHTYTNFILLQHRCLSTYSFYLSEFQKNCKKLTTKKLDCQSEEMG